MAESIAHPRTQYRLEQDADLLERARVALRDYGLTAALDNGAIVVPTAAFRAIRFGRVEHDVAGFSGFGVWREGGRSYWPVGVSGWQRESVTTIVDAVLTGIAAIARDELWSTER